MLNGMLCYILTESLRYALSRCLWLVGRVDDVTPCSRCRVLPAQFSGCAAELHGGAAERLCFACWLGAWAQQQLQQLWAAVGGVMSAAAVERRSQVCVVIQFFELFFVLYM